MRVLARPVVHHVFCSGKAALLARTVAISIALQVGASFLGWFWYVYLVVPLYGLVKLAELVIIPWVTWQLSGGYKAEEKANQKMNRAQKRAERRMR